MSVVNCTEYKHALKVITRYEDDLINDRYISQRQMKSYQKAREIEEKYLEELDKL